jgi:T5SS/PEP-CTERM-associated repeat protein
VKSSASFMVVLAHRMESPLATTRSCLHKAQQARALLLPLWLLVTLSQNRVFAQDTANWNGGVGFWSNSGNWSCVIGGKSKPCVPDSTILTTVAGGTAMLDTNGSASNLTLDLVGALNVSGGTGLSIGSFLTAGLNGQGSIALQGGGQVTSVRIFAGYFSGAIGTVTVGGPGSQLSSSTDLTLGYQGTGTLAISDGGVVTDAPQCPVCSAAFLGYTAGASGNVAVSGTGSTWSNAGVINIGIAGTGSLSIDSGARATATAVIVGTESASSSVVTVTGTGSHLDSSGFLSVGYGGPVTGPGGGGSPTGILTITNGGVVNNAAAVVGFNTGTNGSVAVSGPGATWNNTGPVNVGWLGKGSVSVDTSGQVTAQGLITGSAAGSSGEVKVMSGGQINSTFTSIGDQANSTGTITVIGAGSQFTNSANLAIGNAGNGALTVSNGGFVATGSVTSAGSVTIADGGTLRTTAGGAYSQTAGTTSVFGSGVLSAASVGVNGGMLLGTGTVSGVTTITSGGVFLPGLDATTPGTLRFDGGPLTVQGTLLEILTQAGFAATISTGNINLDPRTSILDIQQASNYDPPEGTTLIIMTASSPVTGTFHTILNQTFSNGSKVWNVLYNQGGNNVALVAAPACHVAVLDPIPELLSLTGDQIVTDYDVLATKGVPVQGVATDGVARLILRCSASSGTATFSLVNSDGQPLPATNENGYVDDVQGGHIGSEVTVSTISTSQGEMAFSVFVAPSQFVRAAVAADEVAAEREVFIRVRLTPTGGQPFDAGATKISLIRPMIFLVHGIWSSAGTWDNFGVLALGASLGGDARFDVQRADYSWISDRSFATTAPVVYDQLKLYLDFFKQDHNVAAVQADVVTHSMGGPLVRTLAMRPDYLHDISFPTFGTGPIRKLIAIAGVHHGTPLADYTVRTPCFGVLLYSWPINKNPFNGAVRDLRTVSDSIAAINATRTPFPAHTIVGITNEDEVRTVQGAINILGSLYSCWTHFDFADAAIFGGRSHDLLVPDSSQKGFDVSTTATDVVTGVVHSEPFDWIPLGEARETADSRIATAVTVLLDAPASNSAFFRPLPR